jgi:probable HAF family extracellular repeat protein
MKRYRQIHIAVITLFVALAMPLGLAAQEDSAQTKKAQHHHYKLIDIGTFGGPQSYVNVSFDIGFHPTIVNNRGQLVGWADTTQPDPSPQFCFDSDCFTAHAFLWRDGERTDLGVLPGGASSQANWISSNGLVAGLAENGQIDPLLGGPEFRAVIWQNGAITDLGTLEGGYSSIANSVNKDGQVVGVFANDVPDQNSMFSNGYQARAFLWQKGVMQDLGTLGGTDAQALLINDRRQVVGWSYTGSPGACIQGVPLAIDSFIWEEEKGMTDLGGLGGTCTTARDLNNHGQVVGLSDLAGDIIWRPFVWSKGTMYDLGGSLGGTSGAANAINERGEAVGGLTLAGDVFFHAVLWTGIGEMTDLGTLGSDQCSDAGSINAKGQVVGESIPDCTNFTSFRSVLWENGSIVDLHTLIQSGSQLSFRYPLDINDRGEIDIYAFDAAGNEHAVLLIPCDDDHPGIEGCDYSMVDADTAASVAPAPATKVASPFTQSNPASRGAMNPMLRRFGRRFGPWNRGPAPVSKTRPVSSESEPAADTSAGSSIDPAGSSCNNGTDLLAEDRLDGFTPRSDASAGAHCQYGCSSQFHYCQIIGPVCYRFHLGEICWDVTHTRCCFKCLTY